MDFPHRLPPAVLWPWRQRAQQQAVAAGVDPAEVDWLLLGSTTLDKLALRLESAQVAGSRFTLAELTALWQRRCEQRVPVQLLLGLAPWRDMVLKVSAAVLVPRPETELLVDWALGHAQQSAGGCWADLGTGSGAIATALARALPAATVAAVDISPAALEIAAANAQRYGVEPQIRFYQGSWFDPLDPQTPLAGIVSNPPYIPAAVIPTLEPEVAHHEPRAALDGGADGLDAVRILVERAPAYLRPGGFWGVELMQGQGQTVGELLRRQGSYTAIQLRRDLSGIERFVTARRR